MSELKGLTRLRVITYGIGQLVEPMLGVDDAVRGVRKMSPGAPPTAYVEAIHEALASSVDLAGALEVGHSNESVRAFLSAVERKLSASTAT